MTDDTQKVFEDFAPGGGACDLFDKPARLADYFASHAYAQSYGAALGAGLAGPAVARSEMTDADGTRRSMLMLGSNSYLNLTVHPDVTAASAAACEKYGYGTGAVSLYAGSTDLHRRLERAIAEFHGAEDAIVFPCGYSSNVGIISALCGPGDVVVNDAANHASIFDGCRLSGAEIKVYLHNNMKHLEKVLRAIPPGKKGRLVVTDGVFSMGGDLAPLDEVCALAARYGARVMVDDAHGLGIVGPTGRGTAEKYGVMDKVDLKAGVLSKSPGGLGGYCASTAAVVRYLRFYARTYFFSTSFPAPVAAGLLEVFRLFSQDKAGRAELWANVAALRDGLRALGFETGPTESAIIPLIVGDELKLVALCNELRARGIYTNVVTYPAVRRKECRLRLCAMKSHTPEDISRALSVFAELGRKHGLIK